MTSYVALLRGVNLGKRQLKMEDLRRIAADLGLGDPQTYIASGNLLFSSNETEATLKAALEAALAEHMHASVGVMVRTAEEMAEVAHRCPFDVPGNRAVAIFLDAAPPPETSVAAKNRASEKIALGKREIYVHYPDGQGPSKLSIPAAAEGTARNMNSVAKLAALAKERA